MAIRAREAMGEEGSALPAVKAERRRIARELHDSLGYGLTVSMVSLENAAKLMEAEPRQAREMVETVRGQLGASLVELQLTLSALRSGETCGPALPRSLERLTGEFAVATGIGVETQVGKRLAPLSDGQATTLYRAAQEALVNAYKHGGAENVRVRLESGEGWAALYVTDDGRRSAGPAAPGQGLRGMRERAQRFGGTVTVTRPPEGGFAVTVRLPLGGEGDV